jgi:hypothetical protein
VFLRNVARLDGGVGKNCVAIPARVFPELTTEEVLDVGNEHGNSGMYWIVFLCFVRAPEVENVMVQSLQGYGLSKR